MVYYILYYFTNVNLFLPTFFDVFRTISRFATAPLGKGGKVDEQEKAPTTFAISSGTVPIDHDTAVMGQSPAYVATLHSFIHKNNSLFPYIFPMQFYPDIPLVVITVLLQD